MEMNSANVEAVVKQVLESMLEKKVPEAASAQKAAGNEIPKTAHVAMLTALEHFEIKEYPMPEVGDGDILVKVEGCGVCGGRNRPGEQGFAACSRKVRLCAGRNNEGGRPALCAGEPAFQPGIHLYAVWYRHRYVRWTDVRPDGLGLGARHQSRFVGRRAARQCRKEKT